LNSKKISKKHTIQRLKFLDWREEVDQKRTEAILVNKIIDDYINEYADSPEDLVIEAERIQEIQNLFNEIKEFLSPEEFDIIYKYAVLGYSQEKIAELYNTYKMDISRKCETITQKCYKYLKNPIISRDIFIPPQSKLTAHSPTVRGYPFEMLQQVSQEGHWRTNQRGHNIYVSKTVCKIPEYVKSKCTLCIDDMGVSKCSRKDVN